MRRAPNLREGVGAGDACANAALQPDASNLATVAEATLCLLNGERADRGLATLRPNDRLQRAALAHGNDMVEHLYFSHAGRNGSQPAERIRASGYLSSGGSWRIGENLAWGTGELATPKAIMAAWMNSAGHRANILQPAYREIGFGVLAGNPSSRDNGGATFVTEFGVIDRADADRLGPLAQHVRPPRRRQGPRAPRQRPQDPRALARPPGSRPPRPRRPRPRRARPGLPPRPHRRQRRGRSRHASASAVPRRAARRTLGLEPAVSQGSSAWSPPPSPPGCSWSPTAPPPPPPCSPACASAPSEDRAPSRCSSRTPRAASSAIADPEDHADTEAKATLELALPLLEEASGTPVTGMVGAPAPLDAIQDAINLHGFDEIILSTLPSRVSRWLKLDLPSKLTGLGLPVTTVTPAGRQDARDLLAWRAVTPFLYWMQVAIVVLVIASAVIAIVKL